MMPGRVAIVFDIPNKIPENGPDISFMLTIWPAPLHIALYCLKRI